MLKCSFGTHITIPPTNSSKVEGDWGGILQELGDLPIKMAIEMVDFPIKNGDFPWVSDCLYKFCSIR